jgi:hypothetical protein
MEIKDMTLVQLREELDKEISDHHGGSTGDALYVRDIMKEMESRK